MIPNLGLSGTTENLQGTIDGENLEVQQKYPEFIALAQAQKEKGDALVPSVETEKFHAALFIEVKQAVKAGANLPFGNRPDL